ncbi:hypothetical protein [Sediminicoccus sp. KRV36]|uniref:hypothetical protein n=1 Tax=Sediminicoccus sp. KRV36 TaxID=3133721 RepID=UPI00200E5AFD|nr:hypothetical protein [Sediminicoccus rosea]UPY35483.1 hypothetical protein LHU95_14790 [Sediminicoccus rosea]
MSDQQTTKLAAIKAGDTLRCDTGFTVADGMCLDHGARCVVKQDAEGLYVECAEGAHYLMDDDDGVLYDFVAEEPANVE